MCQLAAYVGDRPVAPLLLEALRLQEGYFGGQATGLATLNKGKITMHKAPGPIDQFMKSTSLRRFKGTAGIAHSRYSLSVLKGPEYNLAGNAHPWLNEAGTLAMMHNGIINNYRDHWQRLREMHTFTSYSPVVGDITDSEVALHLLDEKLGEGKGLSDALRETANSLTGMVLLAAIHVDEPETIYISNWNQPCYLGVGDGESMFASSRVGFNHVGDEFNVFRAPSNSLIKLTPGDFEVTKLDTRRSFPNLNLDIAVFGEHAKRLLGEKGELDSYDLLIPLLRRGYGESYGIEADRWRDLVRLGYGDANDLFEPLEQLARWGRIRRRVNHRVEGGVTVPRVMWSL